MPPLQCARLLALLALLVLCLSLGQAKDEVPKEKVPPTEDAAPRNATASGGLNPPGASLPLLSVALGVVAALLLHLR